MQKDWKKLVAYSSVSHLGFCTLGISPSTRGNPRVHPAADQSRDLDRHAVPDCGGGLRTPPHARDQGIRRADPCDAGVHDCVSDRRAQLDGMPPLNGFIGERTILDGAYQMSHTWAVWGAVGIALGAAYLLWLFQRTMLGEIERKEHTAEGSFLARDRSVRAADCVGLLDRPQSRSLISAPLDRSVAQIVERVHPGYYAEHIW